MQINQLINLSYLLAHNNSIYIFSVLCYSCHNTSKSDQHDMVQYIGSVSIISICDKTVTKYFIAILNETFLIVARKSC